MVTCWDWARAARQTGSPLRGGCALLLPPHLAAAGVCYQAGAAQVVACEVVYRTALPHGNPLTVGVVVLRDDTRAQVLFVVVADVDCGLPALHLLDAPAVPVVDIRGGLAVDGHRLEPVFLVPALCIGDTVFGAPQRVVRDAVLPGVKGVVGILAADADIIQANMDRDGASIP